MGAIEDRANERLLELREELQAATETLNGHLAAEFGPGTRVSWKRGQRYQVGRVEHNGFSWSRYPRVRARNENTGKSYWVDVDADFHRVPEVSSAINTTPAAMEAPNG